MAISVGKALLQFQDASSQARKFHSESLGPDVNPKKSFGDFLVKVMTRDQKGLDEVYYKGIDDNWNVNSNAVLGGNNSAGGAGGSGIIGGYIVPQEFHTVLMQDIGEFSIFRKSALVVPMGTEEAVLPIPDAVTVPAAAGTSPFFGGIKMTWGGSANLPDMGGPAVRQVSLRAWELGGYTFASRAIMADGRDLEAVLRKLFARSIAWYEDYAFLNGDGVGKPLGVSQCPAAIAVTRNTASHIKNMDVAAMIGKMIPAAYAGALWACSVSSIIDVTQLLNAAGFSTYQPNEPHVFPPECLCNLFGRMCLATEKLPALGTARDLVLFNPRLYVIGDRQMLTIDYSQDEPGTFVKNQGAWRVIQRVDGQPWLSGPVTLQDKATRASAYVYLN